MSDFGAKIFATKTICRVAQSRWYYCRSEWSVLENVFAGNFTHVN